MNQVIFLLLAYFGLLAAMSVVAIPYRRRLRDLGAELCQLDLTPYERGYVESMLQFAYSWRASIIHALSYAAGLLQTYDALNREFEKSLEESPKLFSDPRLHQMSDAFFISAVAVNPLFGLLATVARLAFRIKARVFIRRRTAMAPNVPTTPASVAVSAPIAGAEYAERMTDYRAMVTA